jgi:hypothetical protein
LVFYWVFSTQAASVAVASLSAVMLVVLRGVRRDESLAAQTAGLWVGTTVVSWVGPLADLRAVQTAVEWDANSAFLSVDTTAARLADYWAVH